MIISYDNDSLIFDMHIMMHMILLSPKYQNSNSQSIMISYQDILINRNTAP